MTDNIIQALAPYSSDILASEIARREDLESAENRRVREAHYIRTQRAHDIASAEDKLALALEERNKRISSKGGLMDRGLDVPVTNIEGQNIRIEQADHDVARASAALVQARAALAAIDGAAK